MWPNRAGSTSAASSGRSAIEPATRREGRRPGSIGVPSITSTLSPSSSLPRGTSARSASRSSPAALVARTLSFSGRKRHRPSVDPTRRQLPYGVARSVAVFCDRSVSRSSATSLRPHGPRGPSGGGRASRGSIRRGERRPGQCGHGRERRRRSRACPRSRPDLTEADRTGSPVHLTKPQTASFRPETRSRRARTTSDVFGISWR